MKIVCEKCKKKFKTTLFMVKLCPKCEEKYHTKRYKSLSIKQFIGGKLDDKK